MSTTGWNEVTKQTDHTQLMKYVKSLNKVELEFIRRDASETIAANQDNPKNGYYTDLIHYIDMRMIN